MLISGKSFFLREERQLDNSVAKVMSGLHKCTARTFQGSSHKRKGRTRKDLPTVFFVEGNSDRMRPPRGKEHNCDEVKLYREVPESAGTYVFAPDAQRRPSFMSMVKQVTRTCEVGASGRPEFMSMKLSWAPHNESDIFCWPPEERLANRLRPIQGPPFCHGVSHSQ